MYSFELHDADAIASPSLLFGWDGIQSNLDRMLAIAGSASRLRPHMKTHKTAAITRLYLEKGISKHKCATLREAEVLAQCGAASVLIAYPMVGPNQQRLCSLAGTFPQTRFAVLGDDLDMIQQLDQRAASAGVQLGLFLDFNVGQNRTGLLELPGWVDELAKLTRLQLDGLHLYDGQNKSPDQADRQAQVRRTCDRAGELRNRLQPLASCPLEIVLGGTPAFLLLSKHIDDPHVSLSPGTCILHDAGYQRNYPELGFIPAAAVLTRCISKPAPNLATFDVGTKAVSSDPPFGERCVLLGLESAKATLHNEEHLVLQADEAASWKPGQTTYAIPMHICPTVAMYDHAHIIQNGKLTGTIPIDARSRDG